MTFVGHSLTGAAIAALCMPKKFRFSRKAETLAVFGILANLPDAPLPGWGHDRYVVSHSIFVNGLLIGMFIVILAFLKHLRRRIGGWRVILGGAIAWFSHMLLDSFYNQGHGLQIYWPASDSRLNLPIPWFRVLPPEGMWNPAAFRIYFIELIFYGLLLATAVGIRWVFDRRFAAKDRSELLLSQD